MCSGDACGLLRPEVCSTFSAEGKQGGSVASLRIDPITEWGEGPGSDCWVGLPPEASISGVEASSAARRSLRVDMRLDPSVLLLEININQGST